MASTDPSDDTRDHLRAWDRDLRVLLVIALIIGLILAVRHVAQDRRPLPEPMEETPLERYPPGNIHSSRREEPFPGVHAVVVSPRRRRPDHRLDLDLQTLVRIGEGRGQEQGAGGTGLADLGEASFAVGADVFGSHQRSICWPVV